MKINISNFFTSLRTYSTNKLSTNSGDVNTIKMLSAFTSQRVALTRLLMMSKSSSATVPLEMSESIISSTSTS